MMVVCETVSAIVFHLREYDDPDELRYGGHQYPRPRTLCDNEAAWDTKIPVAYHNVTCKACRDKARLIPGERYG